jgi:hypothetical protein
VRDCGIEVIYGAARDFRFRNFLTLGFGQLLGKLLKFASLLLVLPIIGALGLLFVHDYTVAHKG